VGSLVGDSVDMFNRQTKEHNDIMKKGIGIQDGSQAAAVMHADNVAKQEKLRKEDQDVRQQEARRQAAQRRARMGGAGSRSLLSNGYDGVKKDTYGLGV